MNVYNSRYMYGLEINITKLEVDKDTVVYGTNYPDYNKLSEEEQVVFKTKIYNMRDEVFVEQLCLQASVNSPTSRRPKLTESDLIKKIKELGSRE